MADILNFAQKALIENKAGKILVMKNPAHTRYNPSMLHFPGGRMKFGEKLDEHIIREVFEEVCIKIKPLEPLALASWVVNEGDTHRHELDGINLHVVAVIRYCKYISGKISCTSNVDDEDIETAFWIWPKELLKNPNFDKKELPALQAYIEKLQ